MVQWRQYVICSPSGLHSVIVLQGDRCLRLQLITTISFCSSPKATGSVSVWDLFLDFSPLLFTAGLQLPQKSGYVTLHHWTTFNSLINIHNEEKRRVIIFQGFLCICCAFLCLFFCHETLVVIIWFMGWRFERLKFDWRFTFVPSVVSLVPLFPQTWQF